MTECSKKVIQKLNSYFFSGNLKFVLTPEELNELSWINQEQFLQTTIHSSVFKKYPLRHEFCTLFFKKLVECLQPHHEIHDDIYEFLCSLMKKKFKADNFCYRHYIVNNDIKHLITIKETNNMVVNGTTGMKTWEAAVMLSDWILCNKEMFRNKKVLELGSGVGFTGITVGKLCAPKSVIMTDCHTDVLQLLVDNVTVNFPDYAKIEKSQTSCFRGEEKNIDIMMLDWNYMTDIDDNLKPDIIIGADIVYDPSILQALCNVIQTFIHRNPKVHVYIASIIRNEETFSNFLELLGKMNVAVEQYRPTKCVFLNWDQDIQSCLLKINI